MVLLLMVLMSGNTKPDKIYALLRGRRIFCQNWVKTKIPWETYFQREKEQIICPCLHRLDYPIDIFLQKIRNKTHLDNGFFLFEGIVYFSQTMFPKPALNYQWVHYTGIINGLSGDRCRIYNNKWRIMYQETENCFILSAEEMVV